MKFEGITRIAATGFRGSTRPIAIDLDAKKPFVILFGDNGSGKSTLVDAIEFAVTGGRGSLADISSTKMGDLASKGVPAPALLVELVAGGTTRQARLQGTTPAFQGAAPSTRIEILRRARLARLAIATPADRYKELQRFIDVEKVMSVESGLETATKEAEARLDDLSKQLTEGVVDIVAAWRGEEGGDSATEEEVESTALRWAETLTTPNGATWQGSAEPLVLAAGERVAEAAERLAHARATLAGADAELATAESALAATSESSDATALLDLLAAAERHLSGHTEAECPLCRQSVEPSALVADIRSRMSDLRDLAARRARRDTAAAARKNAAAAEGVRAEEWSREAERVQEAVTALNVSGTPATVTAAARELGQRAAAEDPARTREATATLRAALNADTAERNRRESARLRAGALAAHIGALRQQAAGEETIAQRLRGLHDVVREERKRFVEQILSEVTVEVNRLYFEIHPGEQAVLGNAELTLDPKTKASLLHRVQFGQAEGVAPQACYSESHLSTLALCLWLALAKRERPKETVVVLDDVVLGIDAAHMRRVARLLGEERQHFAQIVVTTHSRRFLRYLMDGPTPTHEIDCRTLRWSLNEGVRCAAAKSDVERLQSLLEAPVPDVRDLMPTARRVLEATLRQLAVQYRRRVPLGDPTEPNLGELYDAWAAEAAKKVLVEREVDGAWNDAGVLETPLAQLRTMKYLRNILDAHLNTEGDEVPDAEVEAFGRGVLALAALVLCPRCGQLPGKVRDGAFRCSCRTGGQRLRPSQVT